KRGRRKADDDLAACSARDRTAVVGDHVEVAGRCDGLDGCGEAGVVGPGEGDRRRGEANGLRAEVLRQRRERGLSALISQLKEHKLQQLFLRVHAGTASALRWKSLRGTAGACLDVVLVV